MSHVRGREKNSSGIKEHRKMEQDEELRERRERKADYLLQAFTLLRKKKDGRVFPHRLIRQNVSENKPSHPPFNLLHTQRKHTHTVNE